MNPITNSFESISSIPSNLSFDAILVLGGGVPEDIINPPSYTKERCKAASEIYHKTSSPTNSSNGHHEHNKNGQREQTTKILTLSAGTAHLPQALSSDGLPIWESTASAAYLIHELNVNPKDVYAETTSYDTISNAFFARLNFCDLVSWKKLLIITNEFHMDRTKLIFDWIFHAPLSGNTTASTTTTTSNKKEEPYKLYYYAVPDVGLSPSAIEARTQKEQKSANTVKNILSQKYTTIEDIFHFLTMEHSFYTASKLVERGMSTGGDEGVVNKLVQDSYGGVSLKKKNQNENNYKKHRIGGLYNEEHSMRVSFLFGTLFGIAIVFLGSKARGGSGKRHLS